MARDPYLDIQVINTSVRLLMQASIFPMREFNNWEAITPKTYPAHKTFIAAAYTRHILSQQLPNWVHTKQPQHVRCAQQRQRANGHRGHLHDSQLGGNDNRQHPNSSANNSHPRVRSKRHQSIECQPNGSHEPDQPDQPDRGHISKPTSANPVLSTNAGTSYPKAHYSYRPAIHGCSN